MRNAHFEAIQFFQLVVRAVGKRGMVFTIDGKAKLMIHYGWPLWIVDRWRMEMNRNAPLRRNWNWVRTISVNRVNANLFVCAIFRSKNLHRSVVHWVTNNGEFGIEANANMQCLLDRCTLSEFDIEPSFRIAVWYAGDDDYVTLNGVSSQNLRLVRFQKRLSTWPKLSRDVVTENALRVYALDRW